MRITAFSSGCCFRAKRATSSASTSRDISTTTSCSAASDLGVALSKIRSSLPSGAFQRKLATPSSETKISFRAQGAALQTPPIPEYSGVAETSSRVGTFARSNETIVLPVRFVPSFTTSIASDCGPTGSFEAGTRSSAFPSLPAMPFTPAADTVAEGTVETRRTTSSERVSTSAPTSSAQPQTEAATTSEPAKTSKRPWCILHLRRHRDAHPSPHDVTCAKGHCSRASVVLCRCQP